MTTNKDYKDHFIPYPFNKVTAVLDSPQELDSSLAALEGAGVDVNAVEVLCGQRGADTLDVTGAKHGLGARLARMLLNLTSEADTIRDYAKHLEAGHFVIMVPVTSEVPKETIVESLRQNHAKHIHYFGKTFVTDY